MLLLITSALGFGAEDILESGRLRGAGGGREPFYSPIEKPLLTHAS